MGPINMSAGQAKASAGAGPQISSPPPPPRRPGPTPATQRCFVIPGDVGVPGDPPKSPLLCSAKMSFGAGRWGEKMLLGYGDALPGLFFLGGGAGFGVSPGDLAGGGNLGCPPGIWGAPRGFAPPRQPCHPSTGSGGGGDG